MVGIISTIFALTGSATAASFVPFTITTSMFISSVLTPLLIDKVNLKWLLTGSQMGKTGLIIVLGLFLSRISDSNYYLVRSEEHTSEPSHVAISYAVFCLNTKKKLKMRKIVASLTT